MEHWQEIGYENSGSRMKMLLIFVMSNIIAMAFSDIFWKLFLIDFIISM